MRGINPMYFLYRKSLLRKVIFGILVLVMILSIILPPQPADAFICGGLCVTGALVGGSWFVSKVFGVNILGDIGKGVFEGLGSFLLDYLWPITGTLILMVLGVVHILLAAFVYMAKLFMDMSINLSLTTNYTTGPTVSVGWILFRDLANTLLVLILIAIGVGTMLNLGNTQWRKLLVPFFIIALLVNFSTLFTGIIIDFSNIVTRIFYDSAINTSQGFLALNPFREATNTYSNIFAISGQIISGGLEPAEMLRIMGVSILAIFYYIVLIFAFLLIGLLLLARILFLLLLVMISPLAFVSYILPQTRMWFKRWWKAFFQWSIIAIPMMLSLWVSGLFLANPVCGTGAAGDSNEQRIVREKFEEGSAITLELAGEGFAPVVESLTDADLMCEMTSSLLALGALFVGVMASLKSSAEGSNIIIGRAQKVQRWARRESGKYARREVKEKVTGPAARGVARGLQAAPGARRRWLGVPQRWAARGLGAYEGGVKKERETRYRKEMDNLSYDQKRPEALYGDPTRRAAAQASMNKDDPKRFAKDIAGSEKLRENFDALKTLAGTSKEIKKFVEEVYKTNPQLATDKEKAAREYANPRMMTAQAWADQDIVQELIKQDKINRGVLEIIAKDEEKMVSLFESIVGIQKKRQPNISGEKALTQFFRELRGDATKKAFSAENAHLAAFWQAMSGKKGRGLSDVSENVADIMTDKMGGVSDEARNRIQQHLENKMQDLRQRKKGGEDIGEALDSFVKDVSGELISDIEELVDKRDEIEEVLNENIEEIKKNIEEDEDEKGGESPKDDGPRDGGGAGASGVGIEKIGDLGSFTSATLHTGFAQGTEAQRLQREKLAKKAAEQDENANLNEKTSEEPAPQPTERPEWLEEGLASIKEGGEPSQMTQKLKKYLRDHGIIPAEYRKMTRKEAWEKAGELSSTPSPAEDTTKPEEALGRAYGPPPPPPPPTGPSGDERFFTPEPEGTPRREEPTTPGIKDITGGPPKPRGRVRRAVDKAKQSLSQAQKRQREAMREQAKKARAEQESTQQRTKFYSDLGIPEGDAKTLYETFFTQDQIAMQEGTWDYDDPNFLPNRMHETIEKIDEKQLSRNERKWFHEIQWLWNHHAISAAIRKGDKEKAQQYAQRALEVKPKGHTNQVTQLLSYLVNDRIEEAKAHAQKNFQTDEEKKTAQGLIDNYESDKWPLPKE